MNPLRHRVAISESFAAYSNLGPTWDANWGGFMSQARPFVPVQTLFPDWPECPPVSAVLDFGHFEGQPIYSERLSSMMRVVGTDLRKAVDDLLKKNPRARVLVMMTSSGGDAGFVTAKVDSEFNPKGSSEPVTLRVLAGLAGFRWEEPLLDGLGRTLPVTSFFCACASSLVAVSYAADRINAGLEDAVVVVAADILSRFACQGFKNVGANASNGVKPYDLNRDGTTVGEGAIGLLLARDELLAEGQVAGYVSGTAMYCDAAHLVEPNAQGVAQVIHAALDQARVQTKDVRAVYWHGTGTRQNDAREAEVSQIIFGEKSPPSTSTKGNLGHTMGASGGFNVMAACETLARGVVPPVAGTEDLEYPNLDIVLGAAREVEPGPVLITALGFGGINAAVVLTK